VKKLISIAIFTILAVTIAVIFSSTSPSNAQYPYTFSPSYPPSLTAPSQYPSYQNPYPSYQNPYPSYQNPYPSYQNPYPSYQNPYPSYQNPQQPPAANPAPSQYPSPSYQNPQQQPQNSPSQSVQQYQIPSSPTTNVTTSNSTNSSTTTVPRNTQFPPNQQQPQFPPNQQQPQFPPFTTPNPPMSILIVITRVNNTGTGIGVLGSTNTTQLPVAIAPSSFSEVVTNAYANPDGYTLAYHYIRGSQMAININLQPGVFTISDQSTNNRTANNPSVIAGNQSPLSLYTPTYSGDCSNTTSAAGNVIGYGQINLGETKTCIITYNKVNR
jgi:hypothetical protein